MRVGVLSDELSGIAPGFAGGGKMGRADTAASPPERRVAGAGLIHVYGSPKIIDLGAEAR